MQGRLLILDAVSTNRIVLNAMLEPACYDIAQGESLIGAMQAIRQSRPDLVLTSWSLPDGTALDLRESMDKLDPDREIPVIAIARAGDSADRQRALRAGLADLLVHPLDETMLQARLRSILRARPSAAAYDFSESPMSAEHASSGFAEQADSFTRNDRIAVMAADPLLAQSWCKKLGAQLNQPIVAYALGQRHAILGASRPPDAIIVALEGTRPDPALRLLADLRAGSATRHTAVIAVPIKDDAESAAHALDLGADDVMTGPFEAGELALRIQAQLRRKHLSDRLRSTVRDGLRAALIDPMTGLYNRRYAIPHLAHTVRRSAKSGKSFAVIMADLDHFKRINDGHGHLAGDAVLVEAAARLRDTLDRQDVIARIGGEEFLIVLRDVDAAKAHKIADRLRKAINARPFQLSPSGLEERITMSVGVAICPPASERDGYGFPDDPDEPQITALLREADQALYESKHAGRNKVTMVSAAA